MAYYRFTLSLENAGFGVTETYYGRNNMSPANGQAFLQKLVTLRMAMLSSDWDFKRVRVGQVGLLRQSSVLEPPSPKFPEGSAMTLPIHGSYKEGVTDTVGFTQVRTALQQKWRFGTNQETTRYLVGIPRAVALSEPADYFPTASTVWPGVVKAWDDFLLGQSGSPVTGGVSVYGRVPIPQMPTPPAMDPYGVVTYRLTAAFPSSVQVIVRDNAAFGWSVGNKVHIYGSRMRVVNFQAGARAPTINGTWYIDAITPSTPTTGFAAITLRGTTGIDPAQIKTLGRIWLVTSVVTPLTDVTETGIGIHKRGKDWSVPRGRRLTRISLDP